MNILQVSPAPARQSRNALKAERTLEDSVDVQVARKKGRRGCKLEEDDLEGFGVRRSISGDMPAEGGRETLKDMLYSYGVISGIRTAQRCEEKIDVYGRCLGMDDGNISWIVLCQIDHPSSRT